MKKIIRYSTKFKRDIKRYANKPGLIDDLYALVKTIEEGLPIPASCKPHKLKGNYHGCWECHIHGDFLLVWIDEYTGEVWLERLGTHSELFGK